MAIRFFPFIAESDQRDEVIDAYLSPIEPKRGDLDRLSVLLASALGALWALTSYGDMPFGATDASDDFVNSACALTFDWIEVQLLSSE